MDRLTTLIERFQMIVEPCAPALTNFAVYADQDERPARVVYLSTGSDIRLAENVYFRARVGWVGTQNPLFAALPERTEISIVDEIETQGLLMLMRDEQDAARCAAAPVMRRLGEVLMVRLLRQMIASGATDVGLLSGLNDPRLARAIVAIHDHPGRAWNNQDLAAEAGLSLSRFSELFSQHMGQTPMAYLRHWRLTLARQDLQRGDRVDRVARRYAYDSAEGFTRAFRKVFGQAPIEMRTSRV